MKSQTSGRPSRVTSTTDTLDLAQLDALARMKRQARGALFPRVAEEARARRHAQGAVAAAFEVRRVALPTSQYTRPIGDRP